MNGSYLIPTLDQNLLVDRKGLQRTKFDGNAAAADEPCVMTRLPERAKIELGNVMIHMPLLFSGRGMFEQRITTNLGLGGFFYCTRLDEIDLSFLSCIRIQEQ